MRFFPFFRREREQRANPENPANPLIPESLVLDSAAGIPVSGETAMRLATVFACVRIISQTVATVRREVQRRDTSGTWQESPHPITRAIEIEPNEYMSAFDFFAMMQAHAELWGNAYAAIERNGKGEPRNLIPLISRNVAPRRTRGRLLYDVAVMDGGKPLTLEASEVLHVRGISLDGLTGLGPIAQGRESIGMTIAAERYGSRFFKNDARPSIVLKHEKTLSEGAAQRLKSAWSSFFSGAGQHSAAVLEEGLDVREIGIAPEQAQFLETRKFQRQEIAALFGVPLSMLADPDAQTYNSGEWDDLRFTKHCVLPRVKAWEGEVRRKLFSGPNWRLHHDLRELERGAFKEQIAALTSAVQNALMTPNEARQRLGLGPHAGGDTLVMQQNMAGVEAIASGTAGNKVGNALGDDAAGEDGEGESDED